MVVSVTTGLANQLEVGEYIILEGLGLVGSERQALFIPDRPVRLEAISDLRLFLKFGRSWAKLEYYYMPHVISAEIQMEMKTWFLVPALAALALLLLFEFSVLSESILMTVSVVCFLGFFRMRRVLEISVVGGRQFRFAGELPVLEGVADKILRQLKKRDERSDNVYMAPPPIIFPPRSAPHPQVVKAVVASLPAAARPGPGAGPPVQIIRPLAPAPAVRDTKFCHMCGLKLKRASRYCPECGERQ
jgi:hypothetical protein